MWRASSKCCSILIYTFGGRLKPRLPRDINLNWISEKTMLAVQFRRQSLCYYNFNFLRFGSVLGTLYPLLRLFFLSSILPFPRAHSIYTPTLWHKGTLGNTVTQITTVGGRLFNYDFSYFSKDYLGVILGCRLVLHAIIASKRVKWQCIKNF